ncbi:MAG TPA: hypothetical protein VGB85_28775, partial [Nannocystis sp.]
QDVHRDQIQFLASAVLSPGESATLPDMLFEPVESFIYCSLEALRRDGALSRFVSLLAEFRPPLVDRLRDVEGELRPHQGMSSPLWRTWDSIPAKDPGTYLNKYLKHATKAFISPRWDDFRKRHEGAMLLWQRRMTDPIAPLPPLPAFPEQALALLLTAMYGSVELRLLAARLGPNVSHRTPDFRTSRLTFAGMLVSAVADNRRQGAFFALLGQQRPRWAQEIGGIALNFGFTPDEYEQVAIPEPSFEWRLGELIFEATAGLDPLWDSLLIPTQEVLGPFVAPRLRAQYAAEWLVRQGLIERPLFSRLSAIAPHLGPQIAELQVEVA